jgi:hypothetical protein
VRLNLEAAGGLQLLVAAATWSRGEPAAGRWAVAGQGCTSCSGSGRRTRPRASRAGSRGGGRALTIGAGVCSGSASYASGWARCPGSAGVEHPAHGSGTTPGGSTSCGPVRLVRPPARDGRSTAGRWPVVARPELRRRSLSAVPTITGAPWHPPSEHQLRGMDTAAALDLGWGRPGGGLSAGDASSTLNGCRGAWRSRSMHLLLIQCFRKQPVRAIDAQRRAGRFTCMFNACRQRPNIPKSNRR